MKKLLFLGMVMALACVAYAYPTLTGPTGIVSRPNAMVAPNMAFVVAADYYATDPSTIPVRALYGIGDTFEVGAAYISNSDSNALGLNAKYKLPVTFLMSSWALGAQYLDFDDFDFQLTEVYLAGTHSFGNVGGFGLNGTAGVNWTQAKDGDSVDAIRLFLGLEAMFANNLTVAAEFQTEDNDLDDDAIMSIVARYPFSPNWVGQAGFTNSLGPIGTDEHNFFIGAAYVFGGTGDSAGATCTNP
ncbi:MAG: hypothetical protein ACYDBB_07365 [Armatimonadota bacterium]